MQRIFFVLPGVLSCKVWGVEDGVSEGSQATVPLSALPLRRRRTSGDLPVSFGDSKNFTQGSNVGRLDFEEVDSDNCMQGSGVVGALATS